MRRILKFNNDPESTGLKQPHKTLVSNNRSLKSSTIPSTPVAFSIVASSSSWKLNCKLWNISAPIKGLTEVSRWFTSSNFSAMNHSKSNPKNDVLKELFPFSNSILIRVRSEDRRKKRKKVLFTFFFPSLFLSFSLFLAPSFPRQTWTPRTKFHLVHGKCKYELTMSVLFTACPRVYYEYAWINNWKAFFSFSVLFCRFKQHNTNTSKRAFHRWRCFNETVK